ncbi:hypothetical protein ElyMa_002683800 [Elysia marginata]|uniref:Ubiquitin-like domain-containing protein n=1 Tax=Elysia marginata TaxID=1093978 RepID=A0AAV4HBJ8_9GAST|nr:hypothetical protein ElyMa_002683800 [Elysia marginata]
MATEVTVKIRNKNLGQALLLKQEEWDLSLSEMRDILKAQEVELPTEYRFLTGNGNVVSTILENNIIFRDVVEQEPFAEIKKDDTSLHSAEERVVPQFMIVPVEELPGHSVNQDAGKECPFINKLPFFAGARGTLPCMRNVFNIHTLLKMAFILTCLLFLMIFVLTLCLHLLFGVGQVGGLAGHGILGGSLLYQQHYAAGSVDQEAITSLKVKISEVEVANRFEIQDLKRKLTELEDMYLTQFRELEAVKKELAAATAARSTSANELSGQVDDLGLRLSEVENSVHSFHVARQKYFINSTDNTMNSDHNKAAAEDTDYTRIEEEAEQMVMEDIGSQEEVVEEVVEESVSGGKVKEEKIKKGKKKEDKKNKKKDKGKGKKKDKKNKK